MSLEPINLTDLKVELEKELRHLNEIEMKYFKSIEVPIEKYPILRNGKEEKVFMVAKVKRHVLFYEDIHDSFEIAIPDKNGVIDKFAMYQLNLKFIINELQKNYS